MNTNPIELSVVAPAHNEEGNVAALTDEIARAIEPLGISFEFVLVDDGSTDRTAAIALQLAADRPWMRVIRMLDTPPGRGNGQSAAFYAGFRAARGRLIAVLDADLQNDPADIPGMLEVMEREGADFVQGDRSHARADNWARKQTSRIGRLFRRLLLGDTIRDTGCSLRVMKREIALRLPLEFAGMHRFIPATARHMGYRVVEMPVHHRARQAGKTKYGNMGIAKRAIPGLIDCFAVRYMRSRRRPVGCEELSAAAPARPEHRASSGDAGAVATDRSPGSSVAQESSA
ncbi:MAG: glycosyltransferase family 2 protein [Phycisphaerales bacterium]